MSRIIIVGAGVSGLTCAAALAEEKHSITVVSREDPLETTSGVAAALWFPFRAYPIEKVIDWSLTSLRRFLDLEKEPGTGIATRRVREVYHSTFPEPGWREELPGFARLAASEVPHGFEGGYVMNVPVIDSSRYLPYLVRRILDAGVGLERGELATLSKLEPEVDVVINCSGVGARQLTPDESVYPIRGQVVRVRKDGIDEAIVDEGSEEAAYVVPRTDDCILGTTVEENVWDRTPSASSRSDIVSRCGLLDPRAANLEILETRVGLRPGRPSVRLERERLGDLEIVHNYGHGGSGYTLSWGCAEEVARLVGEIETR